MGGEGRMLVQLSKFLSDWNFIVDSSQIFIQTFTQYQHIFIWSFVFRIFSPGAGDAPVARGDRQHLPSRSLYYSIVLSCPLSSVLSCSAFLLLTSVTLKDMFVLQSYSRKDSVYWHKDRQTYRNGVELRIQRPILMSMENSFWQGCQETAKLHVPSCKRTKNPLPQAIYKNSLKVDLISTCKS